MNTLSSRSSRGQWCYKYRSSTPYQFFVFVALLLFTVAAFGQSSASSPSTSTNTVVQQPGKAQPQGLPAGYGWHQLPNTVMSSVCLGNVSNGMYTDPSMTTTTNYDFNCNQIIPWSGGAIDTVNQRVIVWGGGHSDYAGNEVSALNLNGTPSWQAITTPTYPVPYVWDGNNWEGLQPYFVRAVDGGQYQPGAKPSSRHTYNSLAYVPSQNSLYSFGGAVANGGFLSQEVWSLNFSTTTWTLVGPPYSQSPGYPTAAYNPNTGHVIMHDKNWTLFDYNPATNTWTTLTTQYTVPDGTTAVVDPVNNLFVVVGAYGTTNNLGYPNVPTSNSIQVFPLTAPYAMQTWTDPSCDLIYRDGGLTWDSNLGLVVGYPGGGNQFYLLNTGVQPVTTPFGVVPSHKCLDVPISMNPSPVLGTDYPPNPEGTSTGANLGIFGRFGYFPTFDQFAIVNDHTENAWSAQLTGGGSAPNFSLSVPPALSVPEGSQGNLTVTTTVSNGFNNSVALTTAGAPAGVTITFSPASISAPGAGSSTMNVSVAATAPAGTYPIVVNACGGGDSHNEAFTLTVTSAGQPTFTLTPVPTAVNIQQGTEGGANINTTIAGGFNSAISLSASGAPAGTTITFTPQTIPAPGSGTSAMDITVGASTPTGTYPITVTGNGGGVQQTATVTLTVSAAQGQPSFTLSASPASVTVQQGNQGASTITSTISNGFNSAISLSTSGAPAGTTVSLNPSTLAAPGSGNSAITITVGASTPVGTYPIVVTGNGGGVQSSATVTLTVTDPQPSFSLSASPSSLTVQQGNQGSSTLTSTIVGGFNSSITLSASGAPSGATVSFNPQTIPAPGSGNSAVTISVGSSTPAGTYPITLTGNGGGVQQTATVTLTVTTPGGGGWAQGFDFRATSNYVTDPSGDTYVLASTLYPTHGSNVTYGWASTALVSSRNRTTSEDPRLAGINYTNNGTPATFYVTLPSSGTYNVALAMGDAGYEQCWVQCQIQLMDGSTVLATLTKGTTNLNYFYDTEGNNWSGAQWPTHNLTQQVTLQGSRLGVVVGTAHGTGDFTTIAFLGVTQVAGGSPNFSLSASPASLTVQQGNQGTSTITSTISNGFSGAISLSASGAPAGTTVSFSPSTIPAPGSGNSTMTITVGSTTPTGTYPITVTGNGGGVQQTTTVTLTVSQGQPSFSIAAAPSSLTVQQGNQGTSTITSTISGGFNGAITLSAAGAPSGATVSFNPNPLPAPGSGNSIMTITVGSSTPIGTYPITVSGSGGGLQSNTTVTLTVTGPPSFALSASPASVSIQQGSHGSSTIISTISNGFSSPVSLSASGAPSGTTVSFNPQTLPGPGSGNSTLTITVGSSTAAGTYPITVTGTGGGLQENTTVTLTVTTAPSFSLSASPASLTIQQGNQGSSTITSTITSGFNSPVSLSASGAPSGTTVSFNPQTLPGPGSGNSTLTIAVGSSTPAGTYPITVTGTGGVLQENTTVTLTVTTPQASFTLLANPASLSVPQGNQGTSNIIATAISGFNSSISLSSSGAPSGTTVSFNPQTIPAPGNGTSTMTITVGSSTPTGAYTITVTGNGGGVQQSTTVSLTVTASSGLWTHGFDFRATSNYVTDPSGDMPVLASTLFPTTTNGVTYGWASVAPISSRNRNSAVDPRLAGINYTNNGTPGSFYVNLPAPGTYNLSLAMGDAGYEQCWVQCQIQFLDGSTILATLTEGVTNLGFFYDAQGHNWYETQWPNSNVSRQVTLAGSRLTVVVGTSHTTGDFTPIAFLGVAQASGGSPSFSLSSSPSSVTVQQGNQGTSTITSTLSGGFNGAISLSASGAPSGTTVSFNPQTIPAPGSGNSTMTITVGASTPVGTYPITVTGNGGGVQQSTTVTLTVTAPAQPSFTLSASPASVSIQQGNQGSSTITSTISGGFNSAISLSAAGVPSGTTVSFNPQSIPAPGSGNSTMNITVGASTAAGTYPITVTGNGGGVQQSTTVTLTVTDPPSFTLSASPASLTMQQGDQGVSTITTTGSGGFNGAISLSASGMPEGSAVTFNPQTIPAPGSGNSDHDYHGRRKTATGQCTP